ncbi:MAG TPA: metallophosphoesterase family protein, partial [Nocardioides sp.]|nr:metallophosphoesterase family protein [Nocardioides sp.]
MDLPEVVTVRGNHERQLLDLPRERLGASDLLALDLLGPADRAWLRSLPARVEVAPGVLAFHGAPTDDLCYLLETVEPGGLREATDDEVLQRLGDDAGRYDVYLCGHTHLQRTRRLPDGSLVVNPGSLGWPAYSDDLPFPHDVEAGTPHARFAVLRQEPAGWQVSQRAIEYDVEAAAATADGNGRPDVARALRTGRV